MTDPVPPTSTKVARPTLLTQRTIAAIAAAALALVLLIVCIMAWHAWDPATDGQRIDWLGKIAMLLGSTIAMIIMSFSLPTNGSEEFSGPGVSFKIDGNQEHPDV